MKFIYAILTLMFLVSCGATVTTDYDKEIDFTGYKSYSYFPEIDSGLSELDNKRIVQTVDSLLQLRGFIKSETPQFLINFFARESISNSKNTIGIGIGGGGGNVGVGVRGGIPIGGRVINQQLTVDFIDTEKDDLIWQAVADGELKERASPSKKEAYYRAIIKKILQQFPPKK